MDFMDFINQMPDDAHKFYPIISQTQKQNLQQYVQLDNLLSEKTYNILRAFVHSETDPFIQLQQILRGEKIEPDVLHPAVMKQITRMGINLSSASV